LGSHGNPTKINKSHHLKHHGEKERGALDKPYKKTHMSKSKKGQHIKWKIIQVPKFTLNL
jgi:hypothetical protein